ncbi:NAD-dependent epimerase/dehydratase family protein [bacterium]|nr:NAD-dependent epimerase/dehydratase family protein [bacterium]
MSRILITGGAGFIGSHLCRRFLADGYEVICVDNFISGSRDNLTELLSNPKFTLIEHDIIHDLPSTIHDLKLDSILHFACPASPNPASPISYMAHPVETLMVNSVGSKNMLDLALQNDCQIIFASTSEVYGDPLVHPQTEEYRGNVSCIGPRACYDEGKRFMEALAFTYFRQFQAKIKVIRIFNTYGPYMRLDDGRFTINLIDAYVSHKPFMMYGDGSSTRSFCYIDDLIEGIALVHAKDQSIGQVLNLGNPGEFTIKDAIEVFENIIGEKLIKEYLPSQLDDPKVRKPDITKAKNILNWNPVIDFKTGMQKTLKYYEKN